MEKNGHTPGPWVIIEPGSDEANYRQRQTMIRGGINALTPIATLSAAMGSKGANARLIAAAPDLLASLENTTHRLQMVLDYSLLESSEVKEPETWKAVFQDVIAKAQQAIAKAKAL